MAKKMVLSSVLSVMCVFFMTSSCGTTKIPSEFDGHLIRWGNGGGFAGIEYTYELNPNGDLIKMADGEIVRIKRVETNTAQQTYQNARLLNLQDRSFMRPGNTYNFVEYVVGGKVSRMAWNDQANAMAPADLMQFHRRLMLFIK